MFPKKPVPFARNPANEADPDYIIRLQAHEIQLQRELRRSWWVQAICVGFGLLMIAIAAVTGYKLFNTSDDLTLARRDAGHWKQQAEKFAATNGTLNNDLGSCRGELKGAGSFSSLSSELSGVKAELAKLQEKCVGKETVTVQPAKPGVKPGAGTGGKGATKSFPAGNPGVCAWIHPSLNDDMSPARSDLAGKRFDKPAGYQGNCQAFVDETRQKYGYKNLRQIQ